MHKELKQICNSTACAAAALCVRVEMEIFCVVYSRFLIDT